MLAKPLQMLAVALLVFLLGATMPGAAAPALARSASTAADTGTISTRPLTPPDDRVPALTSGRPGLERLASRAAAEAPTSIGERRARAVAMTAFSLGAAIGAGFLLGYLIKRLL